MKKALVVLSGGQDSTTCLLYAKKVYDEVHTVTFDYNQRNKKEIEVAKQIAKDLNVSNKVINATVINDLTNNAMTNHNKCIENNSSQLPNTFVAGRNQIFLTLASMYAYENDISYVITGVSETESSGYPDCSIDFIKSFNKTINHAMNSNIVIETPLMYKNKKQVWHFAYLLNGLEYISENTLTCYNGIMGKGCGNCPSCKLRNESYRKYMEDKKYD